MSNEHQDSELVATQEIGSPLALASVLNHFNTDTPENVTDIDDENEIIEGDPNEEPKEIVAEKPDEDPTPAPDPIEEPKAKPEGDDPYKDYTEAALILEQFKEDGRLPNTIETDKKLDWGKLMDIVTQDANTRYETAVKSYTDDLGRAKEYIEHLMSGGSEQTLHQALSLQQLADMNTETEEDREVLIREMYKSKGMEGVGLEAAVEGLKLKGGDVDEASKAKEYFIDQQKQMLAHEAQQRKQADDYQRQQFEQERKDINSIVSAGDLGFVTLETDSQKQKFLDDMFKPTIKTEYQNEQGQMVPTRITRYQQKMQELQSDTKKRLLMAYLLLDDFDMKAVKEQAKVENNSKLLDALNARTTKRGRSPQKREEEATPVWSQPI